MKYVLIRKLNVAFWVTLMKNSQKQYCLEENTCDLQLCLQYQEVWANLSPRVELITLS